jgi:flagellar biosynthetic protein FlhB
MSSERTERATPKRRREARKRGDVPRSTELTAAIALLTAIVFMRWYAPYVVRQISNMMTDNFSQIYQPDFSVLTIRTFLWAGGMTFGRVALPLAGLVCAVAIVSAVLQGGFVISMSRVKPDFKHINPASGFKRIISKHGAFDTGKALFKLAAIGAVTYPVLRQHVVGFATLTGSDPHAVGAALGSALSSLGLRASAAYLVLAACDYAYQRYDYEQRLKMTLQEVKEEHRQSEGNPEIKSRIRRIQRQMARGRMMSAVPTATVVVTNPTHLAVAIRYDLRVMPAPIVVAKGSGEVAEKIKALAREHAIPVMENKPLARALYQVADVGAEIPLALYEAVADVIAYVYRLRMR